MGEKLSEARLRALSYMADTGCNLVRYGSSTGWTADQYQWPISTLTLEALINSGLIEPDTGQLSNSTISYRISVAGRAALSRHGEGK